METVKSNINMSLKVIRMYEWLLDLYVLDFFVEDHWEKLPATWRESFQNIDPQELGEILSGKPAKHVLPLSFLALLKSVEALTLPREPKIEFNTVKNIDSKCASHPRLKNLFLKHVKLKKRHEISLMANVVADTALKSGCEAVIDFGSGLGHLVRVLAYKNYLYAAGIECQSQLTEEARKLDQELECTARKHLPEEAMSGLRRPIHFNTTLSSYHHLYHLPLPEAMKSYGLVGLHPCGDLGPLLLRHFVNCDKVKFICVVGCCYMKLSCKNEVRNKRVSKKNSGGYSSGIENIGNISGGNKSSDNKSRGNKSGGNESRNESDGNEISSDKSCKNDPEHNKCNKNKSGINSSGNESVSNKSKNESDGNEISGNKCYGDDTQHNKTSKKESVINSSGNENVDNKSKNESDGNEKSSNMGGNDTDPNKTSKNKSDGHSSSENESSNQSSRNNETSNENTSTNDNVESNGYPLSLYVKSLDHKLSYASREISCHAIEVYRDRLRKGNYEDLKVHAYRAALERILVGHDPQLKHAPVRSIKHLDNMTFQSYCTMALNRISLPLPTAGHVWARGQRDLSLWRRVVTVYTLRLALAPLVETVVLLDRVLYVLENGLSCEIRPVFDPRISPRNHIIIARRL